MSEPQATTLPWDHLHLNAPLPAEAASWYTESFGPLAAPGTRAEHLQIIGLEVMRCDRHEFRWFASEAPGSAGSVLDHFGWSVDSVDDACAAMEKSGAKLLEAPKTVADTLRICFLEDPWGSKFELLEDPELLGFHHVHLMVSDVEAHREWMAAACGGELASFKGLLPGIRRDNMWILYRSADESAPSKSRAIDHIAFGVDGIEDRLAAMAGLGAEIEGEPRDVGIAKIGFAIAPNGLRIELVEPA